MSDLHEAAQGVWAAGDAPRPAGGSTGNTDTPYPIPRLGIRVGGETTARPIWVRVGVVRLGTSLRPLWWETVSAAHDDEADRGRWRWVREGAPACAQCGQALGGVDENQPATLEWAPGRFDVECQAPGCGAKYWIEEVTP